MFTEATVINGALFPIAEQDRRPNGPIYEGSFQVAGEHGKFRGAAWVKVSSSGPMSGQEFLSFQVEPYNERGQTFKVYGNIYRSQDKRSHDSPDHYGRLDLTEARDGPTLRLSGWDRESKSENRIPFIAIRIEAHQATPEARPAPSAKPQPQPQSNRPQLPV